MSCGLLRTAGTLFPSIKVSLVGEIEGKCWLLVIYTCMCVKYSIAMFTSWVGILKKRNTSLCLKIYIISHRIAYSLHSPFFRFLPYVGWVTIIMTEKPIIKVRFPGNILFQAFS